MVITLGAPLNLEQFIQIARFGAKVEFSPEYCSRVSRARQLIEKAISEDRVMYGVTTGFGSLSTRVINKEEAQQLQRNIVLSHLSLIHICLQQLSGTDALVGGLDVQAQVAVLVQIGDGLTQLGLHRAGHLAQRNVPAQDVYKRQGEGDVSTLPLIGQTIIGEGEVEYHGKIVPSIEALRAEGMEPAILGPKDGLSIASSNAQGESLVVMLVKETEEIIKLSNAIYCMGLEGLNGGLQPLGEAVNAKRGLPGQMRCAADCRRYLQGSYLEQPDPKRALQDPLCYRCGAAINGSVVDALEFVKQYLELQINRTDDNPCILVEENNTSVSPNFETTTLALGCLLYTSRCV